MKKRNKVQNMNSVKITSKVILVISLLVILALLFFFIYQWSNLEFSEFYTHQDKIYEYTAIFYHLPVLLPALIGLWIYKKSFKSLTVLIGYVVYFLLIILSYSSLFWANDPLEAGFFFVILAMPYSIIFTIYMLYLLKIKSRIEKGFEE
ncbi:MAG: hypothetical protein L3J08_02985 [Flavobacteriaceae bacterium]|nr:hypothetical protein [Flavobacteriaceae bacterium]